MSPKKVTLKDIAVRCGVSPTIVSAVLNGRNGRITCSAAKRELIHKTAQELNYQANLFARSIKMKQVPIIGLMLHLEQFDSNGTLDRFVCDSLQGLTFAFNRHHLEVLFIPFSTEEEQLSRIKKLSAGGLIGGVVTNILPDSHDRICSFLASSQLPYMILGSPAMDNVYSVYSVTPNISRTFINFGAERGLDHVCHVLDINGELRFARYPFPGDYLWNAPLMSVEEILPGKDTTLFVSDLKTRQLMLANGFAPRHLVLNESRRFCSLLPRDTDAFLFPDQISEIDSINGYVTKTMTKWLLHDSPPETYRKVINITAVNGQFVPAQLPGRERPPASGFFPSSCL